MRTTTGSTFRYFAKPLQTPASILSPMLRCSFFAEGGAEGSWDMALSLPRAAGGLGGDSAVAGGGLGLGLRRRALGVLWLVEGDLDSARDREARDPAEAAVGGLALELDAASLELLDGALDVVAVERDVVIAGVAAVVDRVD